jgi:DNA-directed RNA polymerase specialized sigma24 family protein
VIQGELYDLLKRCADGDAAAWVAFTEWVGIRARAVLRAFEKLRATDREDVVAETLKSLMVAIRCAQIRGNTNGEIDSYVCRSLRNQALNVLRSHARRREAGESISEGHDPDTEAEAVETSSEQERRAVLAELLEKTEKLLMTWSPEDQYLFLAKLNGVAAQDIRDALASRRSRCFSSSPLLTLDFTVCVSDW